MIFSLEIDRVATILVGSTNGLGLSDIDLNSFTFLQAQAVVSAAAISFFVILTYYLRFNATKRASNDEFEKHILVQSELITTVVVMAVASSLVIFSDLVKLDSASAAERWSVILFVLLYLFIVISPLVHSKKYNDAEIVIRYERMRVILISVILCYLVGFAIHWILKKFGFDPVYETEEFLALGFLWYALALEPLRHRNEWPNTLSSFCWIAMYSAVGFLAGSLYGSLLYSGRAEYTDGPTEWFAVLCWGLYGLFPVLAHLFTSLILKKKDTALWVITYGVSAVGLIALSVLLHDFADQESGYIVGIVTAVSSILIIYIPERYLQRSVTAGLA